MNMLFKNCNLISPDVELDGASILVENNMIRKIFAKGDALPQADKVIDVNGEMTVPGFVDVHCHGKSGVDFSDATDEAMTTIGIDKLKEGVTTFLPTTLTLPETIQEGSYVAVTYAIAIAQVVALVHDYQAVIAGGIHIYGTRH